METQHSDVSGGADTWNSCGRSIGDNSCFRELVVAVSFDRRKDLFDDFLGATLLLVLVVAVLLLPPTSSSSLPLT